MTSPHDSPSAPDELYPERHESASIGILAVQLIIMRIGWIFKTESVIIPHVLDVISGNAAWARGFLPVLNGSACFIAGLMANLCYERPDEPPAERPARPPWWTPFVRAWHTFRDDQRFRRVAWMSTLFMTGLLLFPHYQALAREMLGTSDVDIIWWVISQNISVGIFSPVLGTTEWKVRL